MKTSGKTKTRVIRASYELRSRVGVGPVPQETLEACQKIIDENRVDFSPLGLEFLENLRQTISQTKSRQISENEALTQMTDIVMQLKANAAIFHYQLVGNLAQVMLGFLESLIHIDENAVEIVEAHHKTLTAILERKMDGDGKEYGVKLEEELIHACERYARTNKKKILPQK